MIVALAALYKYGDRTDVIATSLRGAKEALDKLRVYIVRSLGNDLRPLIKDMIEARLEGEDLIAALSGDQFQDAISDYVNREIDEMVTYRNLFHARKRWSIWARKLSWSVLVLVVLEAALSCYFLVSSTIFNYPSGKASFLVSLMLSGCVIMRCLYCVAAMLHYHDQISTYREKIL